MVPFEIKYAKAWFVHLEAAFGLNGIDINDIKYYFTATRIPLSVLEEAVDEKDVEKVFRDYLWLKKCVIEYSKQCKNSVEQSSN